MYISLLSVFSMGFGALLVVVFLVVLLPVESWGEANELSKASGSLKVTIKPKGARLDGARWRVDGGSWQKSGRTISGLSVGEHTIKYKNLPDWDRPAVKDQTISDGETSRVKAKYKLSLGVTETYVLPGDVSLEVVRIPSGSFQMGRYDNESGSSANESPRHKVTFEDVFWVSKYEITQAQWVAVMGSNPSFYTGDSNRPVDSVSWDDVQNFLKELNELDLGAVFRLPSEAEWEYACRAETSTRFYWGDDAGATQIGDYAWYDVNDSNTTHAVGGKSPNAFGLYDVAGNVLEWCEDWNHADYFGAPADGSAWVAPVGSGRILRGGSRADSAVNCRSAARSFATQTTSNQNIGFRVVK